MLLSTCSYCTQPLTYGAFGHALVSYHLTRSVDAGSMLLANRAAWCMVLTSIMSLVIPSMGLQRLPVQHISQHVDAVMSLMGVPYETVYDESHPAALWRPQKRRYTNPYEPNQVSVTPMGVYQTSFEPRQYSNTQQQVPTDNRPGHDRGNRYVQQPSLQARRPPTATQYAPTGYSSPPYRGDADQVEQPHHQLQPHHHHHHVRQYLYELQGRLEIDTAETQGYVNTRPSQGPQYRLEPKHSQLRGEPGTGPDIGAKWQVSHSGCVLLACLKPQNQCTCAYSSILT